MFSGLNSRVYHVFFSVKAVEMYTDLREFKLAKKAMSTADPGAKDLLTKQADWAMNINDLNTAWYVGLLASKGVGTEGVGVGRGAEKWGRRGVGRGAGSGGGGGGGRDRDLRARGEGSEERGMGEQGSGDEGGWGEEGTEGMGRGAGSWEGGRWEAEGRM